MILIFLINEILACEFRFTLDKDKKELEYKIYQEEFYAFGIWTKYYAFHQNITINKELTYIYKKYRWNKGYEYQILTGFDKKGKQELQYSFIKEQDSKKDPNHILKFFNDYKEFLSNNFIDQYYEGVWIFTYVGFDKNDNTIVIIILNTKTNQFLQQLFVGSSQIDLVVLKGDFPGYVSFTQSQSSLVKFTKGEELLVYLEGCSLDTSCQYSNLINTLLSGILNEFQQPFQFTMQDNYWIDGWFQFTPLISIQTYNNVILQIVQYDKEVFKYNAIIPLKIIINFDQSILKNNGIQVETSSYRIPVWDDSNLNIIKEQIFSESYYELIQNWVYFRFLQYDQVGSNAEFYLSFSDSNYVQKNMGQLNLFKYGFFFIYLGQSQLNPNQFVGQLANINIQTCLSNYPLEKRNCHITCLTCDGPTDYNCLSCFDESQTNRIFNPLTSSCNCKVGFISEQGQVQCVQIQKLMKSATFEQFQTLQNPKQPCRDGQFQYNIGSFIKCYDCPQQSSSGILCSDCLENLYTWQNNMKCSYDYYQENQNQNNTFLKQQREQQKIDYYYIQDILLICSGCQFQEGGDQIVQNTTLLYGSCHQGYFYNNSQCQSCQLQNCLKCNDINGECTMCETGFVLAHQICHRCPDYCTFCLYEDKIICTSCLSGFTLGYGLCLECSANCLVCQFDKSLNRPRCQICKFDGYFLPFDGVDCVQNNIQNCQIQYQVQLVLYSSLTNSQCRLIYYTTTLGQSDGCKKSPKDKLQLFNICALCHQQYMNFQTNCTHNVSLNLYEQVLVKYPCFFNFCLGWKIQLIFQDEDEDVEVGEQEEEQAEQQEEEEEEVNIEEGEEEVIEEEDNMEEEEEVNIEEGEEEVFEEEDNMEEDIQEEDIVLEESEEIIKEKPEIIYLISSQNSQIVITACQIDKCIQCLKVQNILKCIQCSQGYYANVLNGQCISCPSSLNCYTCQQQNKNEKDGWKWKIRPYFVYQYQSDLVSSINQKDYEIICLTCLDGYMQLGDKCIRNCPKNCQKCSIIEGQNVCTFCGSNTYNKVLTIYNNQCLNCPNNCEFCQPRSLTDVKKINSLFNPDDPSKYFYSYICLRPKVDPKIFYNQFLQQYVYCQIEKFCMGQFYLKVFNLNIIIAKSSL